MGSRTRVVKIGQNIRQLAHYFQTPDTHSSLFMYTCICNTNICKSNGPGEYKPVYKTGYMEDRITL